MSNANYEQYYRCKFSKLRGNKRELFFWMFCVFELSLFHYSHSRSFGKNKLMYFICKALLFIILYARHYCLNMITKYILLDFKRLVYGLNVSFLPSRHNVLLLKPLSRTSATRLLLSKDDIFQKNLSFDYIVMKT